MYRVVLMHIVGLVCLGAVSSRAEADIYETRTYVDVDVTAYRHKSGLINLRLRPMARAELRFRDEGLVYLKSFLGMRVNVLQWFMLQTYYAHKDLLYTGKKRKQAHLAVIDAIFNVKLGPVGLLDRNTFEWHITDTFFRYRNYFETNVVLGFPWLRGFAGGELRVDSDQGRVNMLDLRVGFKIHIVKHFAIKPFYYLEAKRRNATVWSRTHILGIFLAIRV